MTYSKTELKCLKLKLLRFHKKFRKFSTMDILVPITMKNAAKCDTQCELQNPRVIRSLNAARAWRISS
jgi:hypothetical protein